MVVDLIDCNFDSLPNTITLWEDLPPETEPPLDDSERKWKQKDWFLKQRWYIYNVSKLLIIAKRPNILP